MCWCFQFAMDLSREIIILTFERHPFILYYRGMTKCSFLLTTAL